MKMNNTNSLILTRILIISLAFFIIQFFLNVSYTVEPDEIFILHSSEYKSESTIKYGNVSVSKDYNILFILSLEIS